ncbi:rRNA maturation RNase YbeY [Roseibacillus ishigakijimensis]|uniref:Endoribonuclease YbeY n=1 Tax=Roseibacillus ishigakijimensis TaxID=454146 RepID=A0A934RQR8_9BACT|nr:rRNA maturation RNase YbeY [Roseibacillus ishigakijimensis]MBK1833891.1 rRNA maturation RNase YbeY [Roseibacillus ishigakijimensis]
MSNSPELELFVHWAEPLQESDLQWIESRLPAVRDEVLSRYPESGLADLSELELSLVDDATLAEIHGEFFNDPTVTDVITFPHGEILVSVEMAARCGGEYGKGVRGETFLYLIHGFLHLAGLDDRSEADAARMAREQEEIWEKCSRWTADK